MNARTPAAAASLIVFCLCAAHAAAQGDECWNAVAAFDGTTAGSTAGLTPSLVANAHAGSARDGWWIYAPTFTGEAVISLAECDGGTPPPSGGAVTLEVWDASACPPVVSLARSGAHGSCLGFASGYFSDARAFVPVVAGTPVFVHVGTSGPAGPVALVVRPRTPPPNDDLASAVPVGDGVFDGDTFDAGAGSPASTCAAASRDVWFLYVPPISGFAQASLSLEDGGACGGSPAIEIFDPAQYPTPNTLACGAFDADDSSGTEAYRAVWPVVAGVPVFVAVGGGNGSVHRFRLALRSFAPPYVPLGSAHVTAWNRAYARSAAAVDLATAQAIAAATGGGLAAFANVFDLLDYVVEFPPAPGSTWLGLTFDPVTGVVLSPQGALVVYANWAPGEPTFAAGRTAIVQSSVDNGWRTAFPSESHAALVALPAGSVATVATFAAGPCQSATLAAAFPRIGGTAFFAANGPPSSAMYLYFGPPAAAPTTFFGCEWRLDPAATWPLSAATTDPTGLAVSYATIPADHALLGLEIYVQGATFDPLGALVLTNAVGLKIGY